MVKDNAVELLREQLSKPSWQPEAFMMSGVTDPYQPIERSRKLTRGLIELLHDCKHPLSVITKNAMIERDVDLLGSMAKQGLAHAAISVTTLDPELARDLEPRTSSPAARLRAITTLADAGVPVRIMTAPVIPGLTDHEIPKLLQAAKDAGATSAGYVMLRLPGSVAPVFTQWLSRVRPEAKDRVMAKVTRIRGGKSSDSHFHTRMRGTGFDADQIANLFRTFCKQLGLNRNPPAHRTDLFQPPTPPSGQLSLF